MEIVSGVVYNLRGTKLGIRTPRLLALGLLRFAIVVLVSVAATGVILFYHREIMALMWERPDSLWLVWAWHLLSWVLSLALIGFAGLFSYLLSQVVFGVVIMDHMSRITETIAGGTDEASASVPFFKQLLFLVGQEIPRALLPLVFLFLLTVLGWFTPFGPFLTVLSSVAAALFLAWDNTDLVPARRRYPFRRRFGFFSKTLMFHLGFGLLFLIPVLNILFLSFAPVGATLYVIERGR